MILSSDIPDELLKRFDEIGNSLPKIQNKVLDAGSDVLLPEIEKALGSAITKGYETGELRASTSVKKVRKGKDPANIITFEGVTIRVTKKGKEHEVRNNLKAAVIEYGKRDQAPMPFVRPTVARKRDDVVKAMSDVFDNEIKKI